MIKPKFAISLLPPWTWVMLNGKDIENRSWPTKFRGDVFIHASKGWDRDSFPTTLERRVDGSVRKFWYVDRETNPLPFPKWMSWRVGQTNAP